MYELRNDTKVRKDKECSLQFNHRHICKKVVTCKPRLPDVKYHNTNVTKTKKQDVYSNI